MKPLYRFKYVYPNERIENRAIKDMIENNISEYDFYRKYGKYRQLIKWDDIEEDFVFRLDQYRKKNPDRAIVTHLVIYEGIFVYGLNLKDAGCKEKDLMNYVKSNLHKLQYIEGMNPDQLKIVRFKFKVTYNIAYKEIL